MPVLRRAMRLAAIIALVLVFLLPAVVERRLRGTRVVARMFLHLAGRIAGLRVTCVGAPAPGALIVANHVSWLDVPALAGSAGAAFVAHSGLADVGAARMLCELNDTVFVARGERLRVAGQVRAVAAALAARPPLVLFAEGTTGPGDTVMAFKSALLAAAEDLPPGTPIQPVLLAYADAPAIAWIGAESGWANFSRIVARKRPVALTIRFLPPLDAAARTNRKAMAAAAHRSLSAALAELGGVSSGARAKGREGE